MDWDKLKIFHAVAEAGSFTNATINLNLSQSAISRQIQSLENDLKVIQLEYPRQVLIEDKNGVLLNVLQRNSKMNFSVENPIFVIDPYGRAVMYFNMDTDPKLILKDLKVLI